MADAVDAVLLLGPPASGKSILAMLYGYWVENGTINLDTTLEALGIDDIGGLLPLR